MKYFLETPEISAWVEAERLRGQLWVHINGRTFVIDEEKSSRSKKSEAGSTADLLAPMPGKVTKILAKDQQSVKKGDPILVMEAMKMEYTLKAGADAQVKKIDCRVGEQVTMGQRLVELQALTKAGV